MADAGFDPIALPALLKQPRAGQYFFTYSSFFGFTAPYPLLICLSTSAFYLVLVYAVWPAMRGFVDRHRSAFLLLRKWHNIGLFLYSAACCVLSTKFMYDHGELNVFGPGGFEPLLCNENLPDWLWLLNLSFVASKIYEWLDTAFLVWLKPNPKRDLTFLHVYHHATTFWLFLNVSNFTSTAKQGMVLNGFVHTLMYAHYAWTFPKPLVPLITIAQILQLLFVTWVWTVTPFRCRDHAGFVSQYPWEFWTNYLFVPVYLVFFLHFFVKRFLSRNAGGKPANGSPRTLRADTVAAGEPNSAQEKGSRADLRRRPAARSD